MSLAPPAPRAPAAEPPLRDGDRMDFETFARRWDAAPHIRRAELIDGVVRIMPPTNARDHAEPHSRVAQLLKLYEDATPHTFAAIEVTVELDPHNGPEPDGLLMLLPPVGGRGGISPSGIAFGAVELIVEVAVSSARYDLGEKLNLYRDQGVNEYVVWQPVAQAVDWFRLQTDPLERIGPDQQGVARSVVFPGFWLDVPGLLANRRRAIRATAAAGLASPEHAKFVQDLLTKGGTPADW